jgi:hypothetical protein
VTTTTGAVVFVFSLLLLIASRRLERSILAKHGLTSHLQYAKYIQDDDMNAGAHEHHMNAAMLKVSRSLFFASHLVSSRGVVAMCACL